MRVGRIAIRTSSRTAWSISPRTRPLRQRLLSLSPCRRLVRAWRPLLPPHRHLVPMAMRAIVAITMRPRLIRAAMIPVAVGLRLVALRPVALLAIRRLLAPTALRMARHLALLMRTLLTVPAIPLPVLALLTVLAPVHPRAIRARAPTPAIPRRKISLLPESSLAPCWGRL